MEEAEKVTSKKENDRRGRWGKYDYSENEQKKRGLQLVREGHDEGDMDTCKGYTREKYKVYSREDRSYRKDRSREEQESRHSSTDSELRDHVSKAVKRCDQKQNQEKSCALNDLNCRFLKPSEENWSSCSRDKDYGLQKSSFRLPTHNSLSSSFRKPGEDTEIKPLWRRTHEGAERSVLDQKPVKMEKVAANWEEAPKGEREKSLEENLRKIPEKKEPLSENKASCSGYLTIYFAKCQLCWQGSL